MKPTSDPARIVALYFTGAVALIGMGTFCWCALWKIYIDVPMLLVLSNVTVGGVSSFTTLLTGRTVAQLNQNSEVKNTPQISTNGDGQSPQPDINKLT